MSWTFNTKAFTADGYAQNATVYLGPAHTVSVKDDLRISRVAAKPTSTFSGVSRFATKLTRTLTLTGALTSTGEAIIDISGSIPIGAAGADVDAMVNDLAAAMAHANFKLIAKNGQINY